VRRSVVVLAGLLALTGCSTQSIAMRQAKLDFPACEIKYVGLWHGEVELHACDVSVMYEVTPLGGARWIRGAHPSR